MKTIAGILVLVIFVTVVAVSGSRAQPLPGSSVAFQQCLELASPSGDRCASAVTIVAGVDEVGGGRDMDQAAAYGGDFGQAHGGDLSSPDFWAQIARQVFEVVVREVVRWALDRHFGGGGSADLTTAYAASEIFDPVK